MSKFWSLCVGMMVGFLLVGWAESDADLELSLEDLLNVRISTASKYEQTASEAPSAVTIITAEEIARYGYRTLAELLNAIRGFYLSDDRQYIHLGVRGFSRLSDPNDRILLLLNGEPLNENIRGQALLGTGFPLNMDAIERVEIVRGPSSALYGSNAMFAVINIITKTGKLIDGFRMNGELSSFDGRDGTFLFGSEWGNGLDLLVAGRVGNIGGRRLTYEFDDEEEDDAEHIVDQADWERYRNIFATARYKDFVFQALFNTRRKGIPTGIYESELGDPNTESLDERVLFGVTYTRTLRPNLSIEMRGRFNRSLFRTRLARPPRYPEEEHVDGTWFGAEASARWDILVNNRLTVGVHYEENLKMKVHAYSSSGGRFLPGPREFVGDFPFRVFSAYAEDEYQITEKLSITLSLRHTLHSVPAGNMTTPRGALIFQPFRSTTLKFLYGEAFRVPSVIERELVFHPLFRRNPDLRAERIRTAEAIWEQRIAKSFYGTVATYRYKLIDLVEHRWEPGKPEEAGYRNVGDIDVLGAEFELSMRTKRGFAAYASYTYQDSDSAETKESLVDSPHHLIKAGGMVPLFRYFAIGMELYREDGRKTLAGNKTDPVLLVNLNLSTRPLFRERLVVSFRIKNLFNVDYVNPADIAHRQDVLPQDGRHLAWAVGYRM